MVKGDVVIQQDDVGDSFFILEEGMVSITVSIVIASCFQIRLLYIDSLLFGQNQNFAYVLYSEKLICAIQMRLPRN